MRKIELCFLSLTLLLIPWQIAASIPPVISQLAYIDNAYDVCEKEQSTRLADPATITPTPAAVVMTPSPTADCEECMLHADRIRALSTQVAAEYGTRIPLLIDANHGVSESFEVLKWAVGSGEPGHTFVLVDADGTVLWVQDYGAPENGGSMYVPVEELVRNISERLDS